MWNLHNNIAKKYKLTYLSILNDPDGLLRCEQSEMREADPAAVCVVHHASNLVVLIFQQCLVADAHDATHVLVSVLVGVEHTCTGIVEVYFSGRYGESQLGFVKSSIT